jgi:hypothetical protein
MNRLLLLIILIIPMAIFSQDIRHIFTSIPLEAFPSSGMANYLKDKRDYLMIKGNLVQKEKLGDNEIYIDTIDVKNGYVKFTSLRQQSGESTHEICYWNKKNGQKLIGISYTSCMINCGTILSFYDLIDNNYIKHDYPSLVIDKITIDMFLDIEKSKEKIKNNKNLTHSFDELLNDMFDIIYLLPQKGTNIKAQVYCGMDENLFVFKRKEIILEWDWNRFNIKK